MREGIVDENKSSASKGWNGEVIFDSESTPANDPEKQCSKSSVRRATANDKVHESYISMLAGKTILADERFGLIAMVG